MTTAFIKRYVSGALHARAAYNAARVAPHLREGETVLDFGAGDMATAVELQQLIPIRITGTDVIDFRYPEAHQIPFAHYDGKRLPFADQQFDAALCLFVLHHTLDHVHAVRELARVARRIIIAEDIYTTWLGRKKLCLFDRIGNRLESAEMHVPCTFRRDQEWRDLFASERLRVADSEAWASSFSLSPVQHMLYVLEV